MVPRSHCGRITEHVLPPGYEGVPIGYGKTQMLFHGLIADNLLRIVVAKSEWIICFSTLKQYLIYFGKIRFHHEYLLVHPVFTTLESVFLPCSAYRSGED